MVDRRDEMSPSELVEELSLRFPERLASFEARYGEVLEAVEFDADLADLDEEDVEDCLAEIRSILRV